MPNIRAAILVTAIAAGLIPVTATPAASDEVSWPKRIAPIAAAVEDIRGLEFEHTVPVRFLSEAKFDRRLGSGRLPKDFRVQSALKLQARALAALGMIPADFDLVQAVTDANTAGVAGLFTGSRVLIRGPKLTLETAPIVAHELAHALQSQSFDLPRGVDALSSGSIGALREGDASWVASEYVRTLPEVRRRRTTELLADRAAASRHAALASDAPEVLALSVLAQYTFGEQLVRATVAARGRRGLDALWESPPVDDAGLLDLLRDPNARRPQIEVSETNSNADIGPSFRLGSIGLYYMLASHLGPVRALDIALTWKGDLATLFRADGRECVQIGFIATDRGARLNLLYGLRDWMDVAGGDGAAGRDRYLDTIRCADAPLSTIPPGRLQTAANVAAFRNRLVIRGFETGLSSKALACLVSNYMVDEPMLIELLRPRATGDPAPRELFGPEMEERRVVAADLCDVKLARDDWADPALVG